jgi:ATP-dependent exoDNAse (exonuclease V) beta subunit
MMVMHYLLAIHNPLNKGYAVKLLEELSQLAPKYFNTNEIHLVVEEGIAFIISRIHEMAKAKDVQPGGTTYDQVIQFIRCTGIEHDAALDFLLDHLRELSVTKNYSLTEILTWWDEKKNKLYFSGSTEQNAVTLTTIHSSKGLEYPVVIIPFLPYTPPPASPIWVRPDIEGIELEVARVNDNASNAELFPEIREEHELSDLDELNLLYVATTRPEDRLYIHCVDRGKETLTDRMIAFVRSTGSFAEENTYILGSRVRATHHHTTSNVEPNAIPEFQLCHKLLDVQTGGQTIAVSRALTSSSRHGRILHETLSAFVSMPTEAEQLRKISRMWPALSQEEIKVLNEQVRQVITHPQCHSWFADPLAIRSESEIINEEGKIFRPDRVVEFENQIDVIDFKTGSPREEHANQVRQYMKLVSAMSSKPVRGYIVYIPEMQIEVVADL